jgi:predicted peptidase
MSIIKQMFTINANGDQRAGILYVPNDYTTSKQYPLLVFSHGSGEAGDGTLNTVNTLFNNGSPLSVANNGNPMSFVSPYDGKTYEYIILGLQGINGWCCQATENVYVIQNTIFKAYNINTSAIFKTGLSAGGEVTWEALAGPSSSLFAGGIPMSTPPINTSIADVTVIPKNQTKVWAFHGNIDGGITTNQNSINLCNQVGATYSHLTLFNGAHCCWGTYYDPNYKESFIVNGKTGSYNIYEIMLASMKGNNFNFSGTIITPPPVTNTLTAVASASYIGSTITLSGATSTGNIGSWWWDIVSKPTGASNPNWDNGRSDGGAGLPSTIVKVGTGVAFGVWVFKLNIQGTDGTISSSTVSLTVSSGAGAKNIIFQHIMSDSKTLTIYDDYSYTIV